MSAPWRVEVTAAAERDLRRLDPATQQRVIVVLERLAADPQRGDIRKLQGPANEWRVRVGDWRIRFERDDRARLVRILRVLPRGRAYRR